MTVTKIKMKIENIKIKILMETIAFKYTHNTEMSPFFFPRKQTILKPLLYIYIYIYSCVQNNSSVFKKASNCTVHLLPSSLNKGHLFDSSFFTEWFTSLIKLHTAIILNMPFSINDSITQIQQHACHDWRVCWFSITLPHLVKYLPCRNIISTKNSDRSG